MTIWTPKGGIRTQWHPERDTPWRGSDLLIYSTQIKQERVVHLENVYRWMHRFLIAEGWKHLSPFKGKSKGKRFEDFFAEYRDQHGHKEVRWWWRMQKSPGGLAGVHPYFNQKFYVDVLTTNMKRIEIMYNGKKIKPYMGEMIIWVNGVLQLDKENWFKNDFLLKVLEDYWPRWIYKDRVREQEIEMRRFCERFVEDLKYFIGLNRVADFREVMEPHQQWY